MKTIAILTLGFGLAAAFTTVFATNRTYHFQDTENYAETKHDWESKFMIEDCYSSNDGVIYHYIDSYERNVDHSITFISHDGLLTTIPYPYFQIHVNPKQN
jgi:hypothetical protein